MERVFLFVLNNAITVSALIIAIIVVRALGKKMPKWITCMLWGIVAVKLIVPLQFESVLSLIPTRDPIPANIAVETNPQINSGISSVDEFVNPIIRQNFTPDPVASINPLQICIDLAGYMWIAGVIIMLTYAVTSYVAIRKRVSASVKTAPKVYECDYISDSFILGFFSPRVYISSGLSEEAKGYILRHEFAHLSRCDYIWKPLGFMILAAYWFNPLCWIAYILLCKDIEYACDEKVTRNIEKGEKAEYCRILLENSVPMKMITACPVAFGGIDVKNRIKNVVNYKKQAFWITIASIMVCVAVGVCFATSKGSATTIVQKAVENEQTQTGQTVNKAEVQKSVVTRLAEGDETAADPQLEVKENTDPEIIDFFKKYYEAVATGDIETFKCMNNYCSEYTELSTIAMADHIENYDPGKIYTQPGPHEGTYIVHCDGSIKYKEYDKPIPELAWYYLCTDESGNLYIHGTISMDMTGEENSYFQKADLQPSVLELNHKCYAEESQMYEEDANLEGIIKSIKDDVAEKIKTEVGSRS
ncbi:M56 family metallopeptidase [Butyrivibrio sp. AE2005]|uniref:M56 family metallopeptidase n=1 Tax=Butyrivibrio sp. AE2005 TaxID=1496722 RepID=UPI00068DF4AA|nr:M56 family metallopeptidase [Butyrivibrio sp. AE2005]